MMDEMMMNGAEPRKILETVTAKQVPGIMSYLSKGKWHVAKMVLTEVGANRFIMEAAPRRKPYPINVKIGQSIGLSIKYGYGKLVFESTVMDLLAGDRPGSGGRLSVMIPGKINVLSRRSYFRVSIPSDLDVKVSLWHRKCSNNSKVDETGACCFGRLLDISAGGAQVVMGMSKDFDFNKGQFIGVKFTPTPHGKPLMFTAQIRNVLPTADGANYCLGLQIVGLEASDDGMATLGRLCSVVENYHKMNESSVRQHDFSVRS